MARKTTTQQGYGHRHQVLRLRWKRLLASEGQLPCTRCGHPVYPTDRWDLDHNDLDRSRYDGIAHMSCNRAAGARNSNAKQRGKLQTWDW